jgi:hypothetical protein
MIAMHTIRRARHRGVRPPRTRGKPNAQASRRPLRPQGSRPNSYPSIPAFSANQSRRFSSDATRKVFGSRAMPGAGSAEFSCSRTRPCRLQNATAHPAGCATIFPSGRFELDLENSGNPLVARLGSLKRLTMRLWQRTIARVDRIMKPLQCWLKDRHVI